MAAHKNHMEESEIKATVTVKSKNITGGKYRVIRNHLVAIMFLLRSFKKNAFVLMHIRLHISAVMSLSPVKDTSVIHFPIFKQEI